MSDNYFFSIIIPAYNVEDYLESCLESILAQSFKDFEIVLIDDSSEDNTARIAIEYSERYSFIRYESISKCPVGEVRNYAISLSAGKYIIFVDADDSIQPELLLKLFTCLNTNRPDLCFLPKHFLDDDTGMHPVDLIKGLGQEEPFFENREKFIEYIANSHSTIPSSMWTAVILRDVVLRNNIAMDPNYLWSQDTDYVFSVLCCSSRIQVCNYRGYVWNRKNVGSATRNISAAKVTSRLNVYKKWIANVNHDCFGKLDDNTKKYVVDMLARNYCDVLNIYSFMKNAKERRIVHKIIEADGIIKNYPKYVPEAYRKYGIGYGRVVYLVEHYFRRIIEKVIHKG